MALIARKRIDSETFARYRVVLVIDLANAVSRTSLILAQIDLILTSSSVEILFAKALETRINIESRSSQRINSRSVLFIHTLFEIQAGKSATRSLVCLTSWSRKVGIAQTQKLLFGSEFAAAYIRTIRHAVGNVES